MYSAKTEGIQTGRTTQAKARVSVGCGIPIWSGQRLSESRIGQTGQGARSQEPAWDPDVPYVVCCCHCCLEEPGHIPRSVPMPSASLQALPGTIIVPCVTSLGTVAQPGVCPGWQQAEVGCFPCFSMKSAHASPRGGVHTYTSGLCPGPLAHTCSVNFLTPTP